MYCMYLIYHNINKALKFKREFIGFVIHDVFENTIGDY